MHIKNKLLDILKAEQQFRQYLECDGFSRVVAYRLQQNDVPFQAFVGTVSYQPSPKDKIIYMPTGIHYWLQAEGHTVDFYSHHYFRHVTEDLQHIADCVFEQKHFPMVSYQVELMHDFQTSELIYRILTTS